MLKFCTRRGGGIGALIAGAVFLFYIDQLLKNWSLISLYNKKFVIIKNWLNLELFQNPNIAFSLPLPDYIIVLTAIIIIAALIIILIARLYRNIRCGLVDISLLLIITGAASNFYDRLQYGFVIDYINFVYLPVFNLADVIITGGILLLGLELWRNKM